MTGEVELLLNYARRASFFTRELVRGVWRLRLRGSSGRGREEGRGVEGFGFCWGELVGPGDAGSGLAPGPVLLDSAYQAVLSLAVLPQLFQPSGVYFGGELGVDDRRRGSRRARGGRGRSDGGLRAGRGVPSGGGWSRRRSGGFEAGGDLAVEDDVAGGLVGGGAGLGGDEAGAVGVEGRRGRRRRWRCRRCSRRRPRCRSRRSTGGRSRRRACPDGRGSGSA